MFYRLQFLILVSLFSVSAVKTQDVEAAMCCQSSTQAFAQLGKEDGFVSAHQEPGSYVLQAPKGKIINFPCPDGEVGQGYLVDSNVNATHMLLLFHEWYGVNEYRKSEADRIASDFPGMHVLAVDLYDGVVAQNRGEASRQMQTVNDQRLNNIILGAAGFAGNKKIAVMGWCFGGAWSLKAASLLGKQCNASVVYYGMTLKSQEELESISCPVLGIFAQKDNFITPALVNEFKVKMVDAGKQIEVYFFDADHAFANPSNTKFDLSATSKAWNLTS